MRRICLTLGVSAALLAAVFVTGSEAACAQCGGSGGLYAGACGAPGYGSLSPGCCEHVPSCCDHIWDGYCQERHGGWGLRVCWPTRWRHGAATCTPSAAMPTSAPCPRHPDATTPTRRAPAPAPIPDPAARAGPHRAGAGTDGCPKWG